MAINLSTKTAEKLTQKMMKTESVFAARGCLDIKFTGAKNVEVITAVTQPLNDYSRTGTSRYGTPKELQDVKQELVMSQDKSYSITIDKGNLKDQNYLKKAGEVIELQRKEQVFPAADKYAAVSLAQKAGKIVGNATALSKSNIADRIMDGTAALDDADLPNDGRTLFIDTAGYKLLKLCDEFVAIDKLGEKALTKGLVGEFDGMAVVKVSKGRWAENVNFMIAHKNSYTVPIKIAEAKIHQDPPGISGNLIEGREYYDAFVFGARCDGIYVDVNTGSGKGSIVASPTVTDSSGAIACTTSGATIYHTVDGSDPRYSASRVVGSPTSPASGTVIKCYAEKSGMFPSAVVTETVS